MQAKCLKCKKIFDLDSMSFNEMEKLQKEGCSSCQSKNLEWNMEVEGVNVHFTTDECSKCKLAKVIYVLNWEEIKGICIKSDFAKSKSELIKKMNDEDETKNLTTTYFQNFPTPILRKTPQHSVIQK